MNYSQVINIPDFQVSEQVSYIIMCLSDGGHKRMQNIAGKLKLATSFIKLNKLNN